MEKITDSVKVMPAKGLNGEVTLPGDKSISHRAVILGAIAEGVTEIEGFLPGEDNMATLAAFRSMGVDIKRKGSRVIVEGLGMMGLTEPEDILDAGNSGTTARLMTGLLAAQNFFSVITGDSSLRTRPMKRVVEPLLKMGACIRGRKDGSLLPLAISPGTLTGIDFSMPVASAQLKSALLLAGLYAQGETTVTEPAKSRDHTERMLTLFGAAVLTDGNTVTIKKTPALKAARVQVPGDLSSAAFIMVGALITPASEVLIKDAGVNPTRTGVIDILKKMGASIEVLNQRTLSGEPVADILIKSSALNGIYINGTELLPAIDEFPVICVAAALASGTTIISGARELRVKESDRIAAIAASLTALGVKCEENEDGIVIEGTGGGLLNGASLDCGGDHRVAMSLAVAALRSDTGIDISGAGSVDVSFPGFFSIIENLRR